MRSDRQERMGCGGPPGGDPPGCRGRCQTHLGSTPRLWPQAYWLVREDECRTGSLSRGVTLGSGGLEPRPRVSLGYRVDRAAEPTTPGARELAWLAEADLQDCSWRWVALC